MNSQRPSRSRLVLQALPWVIVAGLVVWGFWLWRGRSVQVTAGLLQQKNLGLAYLENTSGSPSVKEAAQVFQTLTERLPDEPFGWRNLAIAELLLLQNQRAQSLDRAAAERAMEGMLAIDSSPEAAWVAAAILSERASPPKISAAIKLLDDAIEKWPDAVVLRTLLFEIAQYSATPAERAQAVAALRGAVEKAPDNLLLLRELAIEQANTQDASLEETLQQLRQRIQPLESAYHLQRHGNQLTGLLDTAVAAVRGENWREARAAINQLKAIVPRLLTVLQEDRLLLKPHPLDFVIADFSGDFYARHSLPPEPAVAAAVNLVGLPPTRQLPTIVGFRDVRAVDFDQDQQLEIAVLTDRQLLVFGRDDSGSAWKLRGSLDAIGYHRLLVADLDNDKPRGPDELGQDPALLDEPAGLPDASPKSEPEAPPGNQADSRPPEVDGDQAPAPQSHQADVDFVLVGDQGVLIVRNEARGDGADGERHLVAVPQSPELAAQRGFRAGVLLDFDHDADVDLVLAGKDELRIWVNLGDMVFADQSIHSQLPARVDLTSLAVVDWDRDVDLDIVAVGETMAGLLENQRHGQLKWTPFPESYQLSKARDAVVVELDGNVSWDLVAAGALGIRTVRTTTNRPGAVKLLASEAVGETPAQGVLAADLNNDGYPDMVTWSPTAVSVHAGLPGGRLQTLPFAEAAIKRTTRCDAADLDDDGDLDLIVGGIDGVLILDNAAGNQNNWLKLYAVGDSNYRGGSDHTGLGTVAELKVGGQYQAQVVTGQVTHFGLGRRSQADLLRVVWPNGTPQVVVRPQARMPYTRVQQLTGSCPYLYTWDGERYRFLTDCLWAAPLGLQAAPGVLMPSRSWEYLKIPGEVLKAVNSSEGHPVYRLKLTEELWEAAYFDLVELIAVDHPADVDVYSNEKVGPPEIAQYKVHTVRTPRVPEAVRDARGNDLLPQVRQRDNRFVQPFARRINQGLVEEHYLEIDFGELEDPAGLTLFLTGWIYPAGTTMNLVYAEHPRWTGPKMPSVWTPDAQGEWRPAIAFMGFPGGKTKTIAIDLANAFQASDYRVRIKTSAEIYWDQVFFTVGEEPAAVKQTRLPLSRAVASYRGFSRRVPRPHHAPDDYLYEQSDPAPKWPAMRGRFTRYGDVRELLTEHDDHLAIIGSGDEISLEFAVPDEPLPPGWKRDFFLHSVGWDKDADLNTILGQTVEPLPHRRMEAEPDDYRQLPPATEAYERYLREYQTREQDPRRFWRRVKAGQLPLEATSRSKSTPNTSAPTR